MDVTTPQGQTPVGDLETANRPSRTSRIVDGHEMTEGDTDILRISTDSAICNPHTRSTLLGGQGTVRVSYKSGEKHAVSGLGDVKRASLEEAGGVNVTEAIDPLREKRKKIIWAIVCLLIAAYSIAAFAIDFDRAKGLFIVEILVIIYQGYRYVRDYHSGAIAKSFEPIKARVANSKGRWLLLLCVFGLWVAIVVLNLIERPQNAQSLAGVVAFIAIGWAASAHRNQIKWRPVVWGLALEWVLALLILKTSWGLSAFAWLGDMVEGFLSMVLAGSEFVFGQQLPSMAVFAFIVLPTIIYFSSIVSILFYLGVMQWITFKLGWVMSVTLGTTAPESMSCAANIFIGQTEAPLLIRPFLPQMTKSELHAIMTGGFATIAGSVMAAYLNMGIPATHLITASVLAAPTSLALSKLTYPETEETATPLRQSFKLEVLSEEKNLVEAASNGASAAIPLVLNIAAMLIAFTSIMALLGSILSTIGGLVDYPQLSFQVICSYLFWPFAWLMGVPVEDCPMVASFLGEKLLVNEFIAFSSLQQAMNDGAISERAITISTYALCGFANISSVGVQLGGLTPLAPNKQKELASCVVRAMLTGTMVSLMNAAVAGVLVS